MNDLQIKGTIKSPTFNFSYEKGELDIKGRSHPENVIAVYEPALKWIEEYSKHPKPETTMNFSLEYFNTSSSKMILEIFRQLKIIHNAGNKIIVKWHYNKGDDDLREAGEMLSDLVKIPIEFIMLKEV